MRTKPVFLASLLAMALYSHLLFPWEKEQRKIVLEEVLSIGNLDDDLLFQWVGVAVDSENCIYVTDAIDYSLKKFDVRGNLLKKAGRKGQGPGEFSAIRYLGISEKFIYVTDQFKPAIQIFDKELNYRRSLIIPIPVVDIKILSGDKIAVATISQAEEGKIFIFDSEGRSIRQLRYSDKKSPLAIDTVSFDFDSQGNLYAAYNFQDKIEKFGPEENKLWSKKLLGIKEVKKKKIESQVLPAKLTYKDIALDNSGNLFILGGSYSKNPSRDIYVLNPGGKLLTTFTLPEASHCIYIDRQGFLYSRANEGLTLKKFRTKYIDN